MQISPKELGEKNVKRKKISAQTFMSQNLCNEIKIRLFDQRGERRERTNSMTKLLVYTRTSLSAAANDVNDVM